MERGINKNGVVWSISANVSDTATNYHGYYSRERKTPFTGDSYIGNSSLCNKKFGISEDGETFVPINDISNSGLNMRVVCKRCLRIYDNLKP